MNNELISVIIPAYNVETYIDRCIQSILNQNYFIYELILIDDGSPDDCGTKCDKYAQLYSQITVIHQCNCGLSGARNAGIEFALSCSDSKWVTFVDSDDFVHEEYLKKLHEGVVNNNVDICCANYLEFSAESQILPVIKDYGSIVANVEDAYTNCSINTISAWGKLYNKKLFETTRFPLGRIHEDRFTTYQLLFKCNQLAIITDPLYYYFYNTSGITKSQWSPNRLDDLDAVKEQISFFSTHCFEHALVCTLNDYFWLLCKNISILKSLPMYKNYYKILRKELREAIRKYKKQTDLSIDKNRYIYTSAYPFLGKQYFRTSHIIKKFICIYKQS